MSHEIYESAMRRALELALLGPAWGVNPQVGCVILNADGQTIAEGWHKGAGTPHAEVDALSKLDQVPAGATAVVTHTWASSLDGRAAANDGTSKWISGPESRADSHLRRSTVDAILVGTGTVLADDPELTARKPDGTLYEHQPLRVVIGESELPASARVFNSDAETVHLRTHSLHGVLAALWQEGVKHVWVEGGPTVASNFARLGLVDEYLVYLAPTLLGGARTAIADLGITTVTEAKSLDFVEIKQLGADILIRATERGN